MSDLFDSLPLDCVGEAIQNLNQFKGFRIELKAYSKRSDCTSFTEAWVRGEASLTEGRLTEVAGLSRTGNVHHPILVYRTPWAGQDMSLRMTLNSFHIDYIAVISEFNSALVNEFPAGSENHSLVRGAPIDIIFNRWERAFGKFICVETDNHQSFLYYECDGEIQRVETSKYQTLYSRRQTQVLFDREKLADREPLVSQEALALGSG